jgi:amino-acid N-acetyltransferase
VKIELAQSADLARIRELLLAAALPTEDLRAAAVHPFWIASDCEKVVGAVGLERHGDLALLRSLVVAPASRGRGVGIQLAQAAEAHAHELGLSQIYLLTTTAVAFFAARGFRPIPRSAVPAPFQATTEFASLCPATATVMVKPSGHL